LAADLGRLPVIRGGWHWSGITRAPFPIGVQAGRPLSSATAAVLALGLSMPLVGLLPLPLLLKAMVMVVSLLFLPGVLLSRLLGQPIEHWDDERWIVLIAISLSVWVVVATVVLMLNVWSPQLMAVLTVAAIAIRLATWAHASPILPPSDRRAPT
jgi:hypothetical protein